MLVEITGANEIYTTKRYKYAHSVLNLKVLNTCLARGKIFLHTHVYIYINLLAQAGFETKSII